MTFSILARDKYNIGAGVVSGSIAVRDRVPWTKKNTGAIVTQGYTNVMYGKEGIKLLEKGLSPLNILRKLTAEDSLSKKRQVAILSFSGKKATHTGDSCPKEMNEKIGKYYIAIGNMLKTKETVDEMGRYFTKTECTLARRIYSALRSGAEKGGDIRGNKTAAIVVKGKESVDIGIDYSETPLRDLEEKMIR